MSGPTKIHPFCLPASAWGGQEASSYPCDVGDLTHWMSQALYLSDLPSTCQSSLPFLAGKPYSMWLGVNTCIDGYSHLVKWLTNQPYQKVSLASCYNQPSGQSCCASLCGNLALLGVGSTTSAVKSRGFGLCTMFGFKLRETF